jgi:hypothetical protein
VQGHRLYLRKLRGVSAKLGLAPNLEKLVVTHRTKLFSFGKLDLRLRLSVPNPFLFTEVHLRHSLVSNEARAWAAARSEPASFKPRAAGQ